MHVVVFEGSGWGALAPLSLSRPVFALGGGATSLLEKQLRELKPDRLTLWVRPAMEAFCRERIVPHLAVPTQINRPLDDEPALLLNGRTARLNGFECPAPGSVVVDEADAIQAAHLRAAGLGPADALGRSQRWLDLMGLSQAMPLSRLVGSLWDLIHENHQLLIEDFAHMQGQPSAPLPAGPHHVVNPSDVWLGREVNLEPGCVLDASKGPVMIAGGATIGANAVLKGPCWIGPQARVRPLAQVREGTSIGAVCTVGGEVSNSILLGYSNKAHEGFLGHSYVGKWANLGAGTTTSNLKNTYGEVRARIGRSEVSTGRQFLGSVIGDHSKTAVLTRLNAGTYVGFCSMVATYGLLPRLVPSLTFFSQSGPEPYRMDKAVEVTRRVFARRQRQFTSTDEQIMRYVAAAAPELEQ